MFKINKMHYISQRYINNCTNCRYNELINIKQHCVTLELQQCFHVSCFNRVVNSILIFDDFTIEEYTFELRINMLHHNNIINIDEAQLLPQAANCFRNLVGYCPIDTYNSS